MHAARTGRRNHSIALRYRVAVGLGFLLLAMLMAGFARADGIINTAPPPLSTLVKFHDRQYEIAYDANVSLEPITSSVVRKVGYGRVREVNIAQTSSGTYSSDGLVSPHVQYPGIQVSRVYDEERYSYPGYRRERPGPGFSIFSIGRDPASGNVVLHNVNERGVRSCSVSGSFASCYRTY